MNKFRNLSIKFKILSIIFGGVIGLSAIQYLYINSTHQNETTLQNMRDTYFPTLEILDKNIVRLDKIKENYVSSVVIGEEDLLDNNKDLSEFFTKSTNKINNLNSSNTDKINQIITIFNNYIGIANKLSYGLINEEIDKNSETKLTKEMKFLLSNLELELNGLRKSSYLTFIEAIDTAKHTSEQAIYIGIIIGVIAFSGLVSIGFFVSTSISSNIKDVDTSLKTLSSGDGDLSIRIKSSSNDEVGVLANSFNTFIEKLHGVICGVTELSHSVAQESESLKQRSQMSLIGMNSQTEEISEVVISMAKMSNRVHLISENANQAANVANEILGEAEKGKSVVEENMKIIENLSHEVGEATEVILELETHSESIGTVLNVIRGIAEQTNLLALNAAIEAARAGEMGRGFAVVADEVRSLANRTQEATQEINTMITGLQTGTKNAVQRIAKGNDQAKKSVNHAEKVKQALIQVGIGIENISKMNEEIASATAAQNSVTQEINNNIINLGQVALQVTEDSESALDNSKKVAELSEELDKIVSVFKL